MDPDRKKCRIHVCVRLRPLISEDYKLGNVVRSSPERCVHLSLDGQTVKISKDAYDVKLYRVDNTFDEATSQLEVYESSYKRIVTDALTGFNGTGMVYGQTGSGKSHTIFGTDSEPGLVQLAINDVFKDVRLRIAKDLVANVFLSFYQLYLEQAYDLLTTTINRGKSDCPALSIREDCNKGAFVENLQYVYVDDEKSTMDVLNLGLRNRKVHSTTYNMSSSRSHAIFQMYLDFEEKDDTELENNSAMPRKQNENIPNQSKHPVEQGIKKYSVRRRVLTFVDLAGSERVQTHHQAKSKTQFKESVAINKSISALGNCVQALANMSLHRGSDVNGDTTAASKDIFTGIYSNNSNTVAATLKRNLHVPFRDCKLTRLLAEPLGGNSKTCIIVNIGPCYYNYEETKSTLQFAHRALSVRKKVQKGEIEQLQVENVFTEEILPPEDPSPPRIALGGRKLTNLKVSRMVVRNSPEDRQNVVRYRNRYESHEEEFEQCWSCECNLSFSEPHWAGENATRLNSPRSTHLRSPAVALLKSPTGSGYFPNHTLLQSSIEASAVEESELSTNPRNSNGSTPTVRLNLGDFLKACQVNGYRRLDQGVVEGASAQTDDNSLHVSTLKPLSTTISAKVFNVPKYTQDDLLQNNPSTSSAMLDPAFSLIAPSENAASYPIRRYPVSPNGVDVQSCSTTLFPSSSTYTENLNTAQVNDVAEMKGKSDSRDSLYISLPSPHPNMDTLPHLNLQDGLDISMNTSSISAASPSLNPPIKSKESPLAASQRTQRRFVWERGSGEAYSTAVDITPLISRYHSRVDTVAAVASVPTASDTHAAIAAVVADHLPKTTQQNQHDANAIGNDYDSEIATTPATRSFSRKLTSYLKYTPSAMSDASGTPSVRSTSSSPDPTEQHHSPAWNTSVSIHATPLKDKKSDNNINKTSGLGKAEMISIRTGSGAVRDETNSLPRSGAPKPTVSPCEPTNSSYSTLSKGSQSDSAGSKSGPYTFHKKSASVGSDLMGSVSTVATTTVTRATTNVTPKQKSIHWGDKVITRTPSDIPPLPESTSPLLAATMKPFSTHSQYLSPRKHTTKLTSSQIRSQLDVKEKKEKPLAAAAATPRSSRHNQEESTKNHNQKNSNSTPQAGLVKLVQQLRDELQRKEEEISSLRSFILNH